MPDLGAWPAMVAEAITIIRERLTSYEETLEVGDVIREMLVRRNIDVFADRPDEMTKRFGEEASLLAGEVVWVVVEAIRQLESQAEVRVQEGGSGSSPLMKVMADNAGLVLFDTDIKPGTIGATTRRVLLGGLIPAGEIRWAAVQSLITDVRMGMLSGLSTLSIVGSRIALEEAVRCALSDLGMPPDDQPPRAWRREEVLFDDYLTNTGDFAPLDRSATRGVFTSIRDAGNEAAHTGEAKDALVNELLISQLPRAAQSVSSAVTALL